MAISNATTIPILVAARLLSKYRERLVYGARVSRSYEALLRNGPGDRVRLNIAGGATVADYTRNATLTYANADVGTAQDLVINYAKHWAIKIDDLNEIQSTPRILDAIVTEAGIAMAKQIDDDVYARFTEGRSGGKDGATIGSAISLDFEKSGGMSVNDFGFHRLHRVLDIALVPRRGRFLIVGPYTAEALQFVASQNETIAASPVSGLVNGNIGSFGGFRIYVGHKAKTALNSGVTTATEQWIYGVDDATEFAEQVRKVERIRLETTFADAVRGLVTYGMKIVKPTAVYNSAVTITKVAV